MEPVSPPQAEHSPSRGCSLGRDLVPSVNLTYGLPLDALEQRAFHHFRLRSAQDLSGLIDLTFWNEYITRMSISNPVIQQAVVALSAVHEAHLDRKRGRIDDGFLQPHKLSATYALKKYGQAVQRLNTQLQAPTVDDRTVELTLVACLLFICIEILLGNDFGALAHLDGGLQMLSKACDYQYQPFASSALVANSSISALTRVFARLDIQASAYIATRAIKSTCSTAKNVFPHPELSITKPFQYTFSQSFLTVADARDALNTLLAYIYQFLRFTLSKLPSRWNSSPKHLHGNQTTLNTTAASDNLLATATLEQDLYLNALEGWKHEFHALLARIVTNGFLPANKGSREGTILWLTYLVTLIKLSTSLDPDEVAYDAFLPQFTAIVEHAEPILLPPTSTATATHDYTTRGFTIEMGVIHPLHFTAVKCRDHALRNRAISLLRISKTEGVWDGELHASMADHVITLEEEDAPVGAEKASFFVPEFARVHSVGFAIDRLNRTAELECSRRTYATGLARGEMEWKTQKGKILW